MRDQAGLTRSGMPSAATAIRWSVVNRFLVLLLTVFAVAAARTRARGSDVVAAPTSH